MASTDAKRLPIAYISSTMPDSGGWKRSHVNAIISPTSVEAGVVDLLRAWLKYADKHEARFELRIGDDYVLGPAWAGIGVHLRTLLNGDLGRLDGGTLDTIIYKTLEAEGFDPEEL